MNKWERAGEYVMVAIYLLLVSSILQIIFLFIPFNFGLSGSNYLTATLWGAATYIWITKETLFQKLKREGWLCEYSELLKKRV